MGHKVGLTWTVLWEKKWRRVDTGYHSTGASTGLPVDSLSGIKEDSAMTEFSYQLCSNLFTCA